VRGESEKMKAKEKKEKLAKTKRVRKTKIHCVSKKHVTLFI